MRLRVCEMASYFGIEDWFYKDIHKLSGGQKQLLNLAAVMATSPDVLILDEPTAQLDPITAGNFISTLKKLNNDLGTTIIIAEHRLEELFPLADRVLAMNQGQITFNGSARKLCTLADDSVKESLPCAARIFLSLSARGECPLTVNEGRQFLNNFNFDPQYGKKHIVSKPVGKKLLELKEVFFRYERNSQDILKGLSLTAWENETLCILGANGTGKTTLLKVAAGILKPRLGKVIRCQDGEVALLPQNSSDILIKDTILEDFECVCQAAGYSRKNSEERIHTVSEKLFITNLMKRHSLDLSGGEMCIRDRCMALRPALRRMHRRPPR